MNDNKWADLVESIESKFEVLENTKYDVDYAPGAFAEAIVFIGPMGKMKLERVTKPRVVGEQTYGGSKYGAATGVEKIYSKDEVVNILKAYKEVNGEWEEANEHMFE